MRLFWMAGVQGGLLAWAPRICRVALAGVSNGGRWLRRLHSADRCHHSDIIGPFIEPGRYSFVTAIDAMTHHVSSYDR